MKITFHPMKIGRDWANVKKVLPVRLCEDTRGILALDEQSGSIVAAVILDNWTHTAVQMHQWVGHPMVLRHGWLEEIYQFVFQDAGRDIIIGLVPGNNEKALKFNEHLGFKEVYRIKEGFGPDEDYVIMEGRREDFARWAPEQMREAANG